MANVPSSGDQDTQVDAVKRLPLGMRVFVWACLMTVLLLVFLGYRQMELLIAWVTATLC
jgi:type VI protein secretion system component VasF